MIQQSRFLSALRHARLWTRQRLHRGGAAKAQLGRDPASICQDEPHGRQLRRRDPRPSSAASPGDTAPTPYLAGALLVAAVLLQRLLAVHDPRPGLAT